MKFTTTEKQIDSILSPALVRGGKNARSMLARLLKKHRRDHQTVKFINKTATFIGYPEK